MSGRAPVSESKISSRRFICLCMYVPMYLCMCTIQCTIQCTISNSQGIFSVLINFADQDFPRCFISALCCMRTEHVLLK